MSKFSLKQLKAAAVEMNDIFGLDPEIDTKIKDVDELEALVTEAAKLATADDEFSDETLEVIEGLLNPEEEIEEEVKKPAGKKEKAPAVKEVLPEPAPGKKGRPEKAAPVEEVEEVEDMDDWKKYDAIEDEINDAEDLETLVDIAKEYSEFKGIRGKLKEYKKLKDLKKDLLKIVDDLRDAPEDQKPEPEPKKAKTPNVKEVVQKIDNEKEATKKAAKKAITVVKEEAPAKAEKPAAKKGPKTSQGSAVREFLATLIEKGKMNAKELTEKAMEKFPDSAKSSIVTMITDGKNPKYNRFPKLVVADADGKLSFKK